MPKLHLQHNVKKEKNNSMHNKANVLLINGLMEGYLERAVQPFTLKDLFIYCKESL